MMPILVSPGTMSPGVLGADQDRPQGGQAGFYGDDILNRNAFRDADDEANPGLGGFAHGGRRPQRGHEDDRSVSSRRRPRLGGRIKDGKSEVKRPALARRNSADDAGSSTGLSAGRERSPRGR